MYLLTYLASTHQITLGAFNRSFTPPLALMTHSFYALSPVMHNCPTCLHLGLSRRPTVCAFMFYGEPDPSRNTERAFFAAPLSVYNCLLISTRIKLSCS